MRTKIGVSDVGQMRYAGLFSQCRVFNLHKVSDLDRICQNAVRTQMAVRSDSNTVSYLGFFDEGGMNLASISNLTVFDDGIWSDHTVFPNLNMTNQLGTWCDRGISSNGNVRRNYDSIRTIKVYTIFQKSVNHNFVRDFI